MSNLRILIVEDHETVREGLKLIVSAQPDMDICGEASNGRAAISEAQNLQPDIVLMDVSMPEMNGLDATKRLKKLCPEIKIITLTRHTDNGYLQELLAAGASGYVLKQSAASELIRAIRSVAAGGTYLDPSIAGKVIGSFQRRFANPSKKAKDALTEREQEILRFIALGFSNKEISYKLHLSIKTVEAHKANAMRKLDMSSRIDIVRYAILQGWMREN